MMARAMAAIYLGEREEVERTIRAALLTADEEFRNRLLSLAAAAALIPSLAGSDVPRSPAPMYRARRPAVTPNSHSIRGEA
jgi:hypothetical protein